MQIPTEEFPEGFATFAQPMLDGRHRFVASLNPTERWVCDTTVAYFVERGRGPTRSELLELRTNAEHSAAAVDAALEHLNQRDMLVLEGDRVIALYPFSDRPCPHRVRVGGKRLYAM